MLTGITAVAFDLDGTLYPEYRLNLRLIPFAFRHGPLLAAFGMAREMIRREQKRAQTDRPDFYDYQARLTAGILKAQPDRIREKIDRLIYTDWARHFSKIKLFPHVTEFLDGLRAAKIKTGLLSDFLPHAKLEKLGLSGYWDTVLCSESIGALKPARRPFDELARALDCPPEQILYVGNSRRYDAQGAMRAGMKTALKTNRFFTGVFSKGNAGANFAFHDYRQLYNFMLR